MDVMVALGALWLVHIAAVASPGPSFVVVSRAAAAGNAMAGVRIAAGLTLGTLVWAGAAWFGLAVLFELVPSLYDVMRVAGALFLLYIAAQLWRHAREPLPGAEGVPEDHHRDRHRARGRAFRLGVATQLANPKVAVFFGSIFAAMLPPDPPAWVVVAAFAIVCLDEFAWYAAVALVLSRPAMRRGYARAKAWVDRVTGGVLGALAVRLLVAG